jgi:muramidase (phage lysozyme)
MRKPTKSPGFRVYRLKPGRLPMIPAALLTICGGRQPHLADHPSENVGIKNELSRRRSTAAGTSFAMNQFISSQWLQNNGMGAVE